jgi:hypothetical protein
MAVPSSLSHLLSRRATQDDGGGCGRNALTLAESGHLISRRTREGRRGLDGRG